MQPIRYVDALIAQYGAMGFPPYDWSRYDEAAFTPLYYGRRTALEALVSPLRSGRALRGSRDCRHRGRRAVRVRRRPAANLAAR